MRALDDASRDVRTSALRLAERWLSNPDSPVVAAVLKRLDDADWNVRRQLAATLGEMRQADKHAAIATLLERHGDDPVTVDAAVSSVAGSEIAVLDRLLLAAAASPQRTSAIAMLSASILTGGQEPAIQRLFDLMAEDTRAAWQRGALMLGAEVALLGAPAPGTPLAGAAAAAPDRSPAPSRARRALARAADRAERWRSIPIVASTAQTSGPRVRRSRSRASRRWRGSRRALATSLDSVRQGCSLAWHGPASRARPPPRWHR